MQLLYRGLKEVTVVEVKALRVLVATVDQNGGRADASADMKRPYERVAEQPPPEAGSLEILAHSQSR